MVGLDPLCARTEQQRASLCSRLLTCSPSISKRPLSGWMHARGTAAEGSLPGDRFSRPWQRQTSYRHRERQGFDVPAHVNPSTCSRQDRATLSQASILGRSGADHALAGTGLFRRSTYATYTIRWWLAHRDTRTVTQTVVLMEPAAHTQGPASPVQVGGSR